ncbi:helix-turn-helix domain-containing protein [Salinisphaera sp. SWV1]|uniref:helix-turn-helix domain-containing protein n=1 Tax=Salinisphaera sp. SWV1 TaxID=3454139 RepID=UPI003F84658A
MQTAILTPSQSRDARDQLALSQGRVAADTGVSRAYLSQFECGKLALRSAELKLLREFYASRGVEFMLAPADDPAEPGPSGPRVRDGFLIPDTLTRDEADDLLNMLVENDEQARKRLMADAPNDSVLPGKNMRASAREAREAINLMARNWLLVLRLHGREFDPLIESKSNGRTVGLVHRRELVPIFEGNLRNTEYPHDSV